MSNGKHYNGMYYIEYLGHQTDSRNEPKSPPEVAMLMHNEGIDLVKIHPIPLKPKKDPASKVEDGQHPDSIYKKKLEEILSRPNCNDCDASTTNACGMCPPPGAAVLINCPYHRPKREADK